MVSDLRLVPFVRIRTTWSDGSKPTETAHLEEWFAADDVLALYAYAPFWDESRVRPVRAVLFDRVWSANAPGLVQ